MKTITPIKKTPNRLLNSKQAQQAWKRFNILSEKIRKQWKTKKSTHTLLREERE